MVHSSWIHFPRKINFNCLFVGIMIKLLSELAHSKTILENTVEIEPQPLALDFKNFSQYSSRFK